MKFRAAIAPVAGSGGLAAVSGPEAPLKEMRIELPGLQPAVGNYLSAKRVDNPVIDGCSDLLVEVFGEEVGRHAPSAVGMAELPMNISVEIEMVVAVERE